jgi:hypothetical protein
MKRINIFWIITGVVGLTANILAIIDTFSDGDIFAGWHMDRGMLAVLTFVLMAYCLATWAALTWRWTHGRWPGQKYLARRPAIFLLNSLATFPLLTIWFSMLFSVVLFSEISDAQRWILAMGFAWGATPFVAFGLTSVGEMLGPLLSR